MVRNNSLDMDKDVVNSYVTLDKEFKDIDKSMKNQKAYFVNGMRINIADYVKSLAMVEVCLDEESFIKEYHLIPEA